MFTEEQIAERCKPYESKFAQNPNQPRRGTGKADGVLFLGETFIPRPASGGATDKVITRASRELAALKYLKPMDDELRVQYGFTAGSSCNQFLLAELMFQCPSIEEEANAKIQPVRALFHPSNETTHGHHPEHRQNWHIRKVEEGIWVAVYDKTKTEKAEEKKASK